MAERHPFRPHHPVDHAPARLAHPQAVPEILLRRDHERGRLVVVEGTPPDEIRSAYLDLVKIWQKMNAKRFDNIMLKTKTVGAEATPEGIKVTFAPAEEGGTAPEPQVYDLVLQAVGRTPNGKKIAAEKAGVAVTDRGFINVDIQMRTNVPHIFAIGDIVGQPMLAHKAVHEAHVAAEVIAGELQGNKELASAAFNARVIPSVAYTDPEVAWVGLTEDQAKQQGIKVKKGLFPWAASGRAIANDCDERRQAGLQRAPQRGARVV